MKSLPVLMTCLLVAILNGTIEGDTVDFTDGVFKVVLDAPAIGDEPVIFSETTAGATLTFESTANLVGIERFLGIQPGVVPNSLQWVVAEGRLWHSQSHPT